jgi:hypothetical protein
MILPHSLVPTALLLTPLLLASAVGACQKSDPPTHADAALRADCREQMNRQYNAQNRSDLTRRDERDFAFSGSYNTGIASRGLGAEYQREQMVTDCLRAAGDRGGQAVPGVGPTFSPVSGAPTPLP